MGFGTDLKNVYLPCTNRTPHFMNGAGQARMTEPYFVEEVFKISGLEPSPWCYREGFERRRNLCSLAHLSAWDNLDLMTADEVVKPPRHP